MSAARLAAVLVWVVACNRVELATTTASTVASAPMAMPAAPREPDMLGVVVPREELALAADAIARIHEVRVAAGDSVRAGEVLVRLDPSETRGELAAARAALRAARAESARLALAADHATRQLAHAEPIAAMIADDELRTLAHSRDDLALGRRRAEADAAGRGARVEDLTRRVAAHELASPWAGHVTEVRMTAGAVVEPGAAIVRISSDARLIRFAAPADAPPLANGDAVVVAVAELELVAHVERIATEIDPATRIVMVEAALTPDDAKRVRVGAIARVRRAS